MDAAELYDVYHALIIGDVGSAREQLQQRLQKLRYPKFTQMLGSEPLRSSFRDFLQLDLCEEQFDFVVDVQRFKDAAQKWIAEGRSDVAPTDDSEASPAGIYERWFLPCELNLSQQEVRDVHEAVANFIHDKEWESGDKWPQMYDNSCASVCSMLVEPYQRWSAKLYKPKKGEALPVQEAIASPAGESGWSSDDDEKPRATRPRRLLGYITSTLTGDGYDSLGESASPKSKRRFIGARLGRSKPVAGDVDLTASMSDGEQEERKPRRRAKKHRRAHSIESGALSGENEKILAAVTQKVDKSKQPQSTSPRRPTRKSPQSTSPLKGVSPSVSPKTSPPASPPTRDAHTRKRENAIVLDSPPNLEFTANDMPAPPRFVVPKTKPSLLETLREPELRLLFMSFLEEERNAEHIHFVEKVLNFQGLVKSREEDEGPSGDVECGATVWRAECRSTAKDIFIEAVEEDEWGIFDHSAKQRVRVRIEELEEDETNLPPATLFDELFSEVVSTLIEPHGRWWRKIEQK